MLNKNSSKKVLLEKIVHMYQSLIKGEKISNDNFWNEFFLLKANGNALEQELAKIDDINNVKRIVNLLFEKSLEAIQESNQLKIINGLITLCTISYHVLYTLKKTKISEDKDSNEILGILFKNSDNNSEPFNKLIESISTLIFNDIHPGIKSIALKSLLIYSMAFKNIDTNPFIEIFISYQEVFDALIGLFNQIDYNQQQQQDELRILLLLTIFLNYKKPNINPYVMKFSILDNEIILNRYSKAITNQLIKFNMEYDQLRMMENKTGFFSSISSMVGTIFSNEDNSSASLAATNVLNNSKMSQTVNLALLALYRAVSLNRNFISLLTMTPSELLNHRPSSDDNNSSNNEPDSKLSYSLNEMMMLSPPTNLLIAFLEFSSIVMLGMMKDEFSSQTTRLCFTILTSITEDACANAIIHDNNMLFNVNLKRTSTRHRKVSQEKTKGVRPICHFILDLMIEFIIAHLHRHIKQESFLFCLGIIHRLLCFQKRCQVRIHFDWKELWSALIMLIKFLLNNETYFIQQQHFDVCLVGQKIVNIFNMFILYGDHFLYSDHYYDELYYEIIRIHNLFDNLNSLALKYISKENINDIANGNHHRYKESPNKLANSLLNIKAIIAHLNAKLELYSEQNKIVTLSEEQVFDVVRQNYDSLTLKLPENLDLYEPYDFSKPNEVQFFSLILQSIIEDFVQNNKRFTNVTFDEQHNLIQEIQIMSAVNLVRCSSNANSDSNIYQEHEESSNKAN